MARPTNGTGQGGKSFQDREKAAKLRHTVLDSIQQVMDGDKSVEKWSDYKKELIRKMSNTILPRLNEHTGDSGAPISITFDNSFDDKAE